MSASPDDPLAQPLLPELAAEYSQQAEARYEAAEYRRLNEPLPSRGSFEPIAFAKGLP